MNLRSSSRLRRAFGARRFNGGPGPEEQMTRSAVVFAPHQDDETLGCGGTIALKRRAGALVTIVYMTDGRTSHQKFMPVQELCPLRKQEALKAGEVLGLRDGDIQFLDFPDGELGEYHEFAVTKVSAILSRLRPADVFVPYQADKTSDHEATYKIVIEAIKRSALEVDVYEYPVWLWNQWPWTGLELGPNRDSLKAIWHVIRSGFGSQIFKEFDSAVHVREVLDIKREALAQHRSQMVELIPGVGWPTLGGVAQGDFLKCFFQDFEIFRRRRSAQATA